MAFNVKKVNNDFALPRWPLRLGGKKFLMKRCFVDRNIWPQNEGELCAEESRHLLAVLRGRPGEIIEIFNGYGRTAQAELLAGEKNIARIKVIPESIRRVEPPCPAFTLLQAVPKHSCMELIIQKATELGAQKIIPVITERVVVKFNSQSAVQRAARWQKVALAAAKQCRAAWLPEILPVVPLTQAVAGLQSDLKIFGALASRAPAFKEFLRKAEKPVHSPDSTSSPQAGSGQALENITLAIGPEGDFTEEETKLFLKANFAPVSFGHEVLRVETAAIFGLSVLKYEFSKTLTETTEFTEGKP